MRVTFQSGSWVDLRDIGTLNARDKANMLAATVMPVSTMTDEGFSIATVSMATYSMQLNAVIDGMITAWSYDFVLPANDDTTDENSRKAYDQSLMQLPIDDWNELEVAIEPYLQRLRSGGPKGGATTTSRSSGTSKARAGNPRKTSVS